MGCDYDGFNPHSAPDAFNSGGRPAVWLNSAVLFGMACTPCGCSGWDRYRVGNLDVRECRDCKATWTERHQSSKGNRVIL